MAALTFDDITGDATSPRGPLTFEDVAPLTWGQFFRNLITGEYTTTEHPNAEEFGRGRATPGLTPEQAAAGDDLSLAGINRAAITSDPAAQLDILRRNVPGLEHTTDRHGNVMVRAPRYGVTEWAYLNRPGASVRDLDEFATQLLATLPLGGLFGLGSTVPRRIATGAAAGAGSSVLTDVGAMASGSEQGIDPLRAGVSGAVGGALGPLTPRAGTGRAPPPLTGGQEAVQAAERLNTGVLAPTGQRVDVPRAMASDNRAVQMAGGASQRLPFGSPLEGAAESTVAGLGRAADETAAGFGSAAGPLHAGDIARQGVLDWVRGGSAAVARRVYGAVDDIITRAGGHGVTVPLAETRVAVRELERQMRESTGTAAESAIDIVADAIRRPGGLTWRGAQQLRTELSERLSGSILPEAGTSMPALRALREALTIDMGRIVDAAGGPRAVAAWHRADRVFSQIAQRREDLARIVGTAGDVAPEAVFERLIAMARAGGRADVGRLRQARGAMGADAWNEVASSAVARLGRNAQGEFSPARFLTEYGRLTPNGRQALFGSTGRDQLWRALDDIETVSRRFQETMTRYSNPSGTGRALTTTAGIAGMVTMPLQTLAAGIGGYALAGALARPVTARAVARWVSAYTQAATVRGRAGMVVLQQAERQLHEALAAEGITPDGGRQQ